MKVLVVAGGLEPSTELIKYISSKVDYIIGVDKGCNCLLRNNIIPQYIMGDFDSIDESVLKKFKQSNVKFTKYNAEKDFTDTESAFEYSINELKAEYIYLLGGTGKRMDHFFGNIGVLKRALDKNINAYMLDDYNEIYLINQSQTIQSDKGKYISFQAYCDCVENFTIKNAKYELENYSLSLGDPLTISNEFMDRPIKVSFDSGTLLIIKSID